MKSLYSLLALAGLVAACSHDDSTTMMDMATPDMSITAYSCDPGQAPYPQCREFTNVMSAQTMTDLNNYCGGSLKAMTCTRTSTLGACRATAATYTLTIWYYPDSTMYTTSAQVQTACSKQSGTVYVPPPA